MNILRSTLLIFICVSLASCGPILKIAYGIKKPKIENKKSIIDYLTKKDIDTSNVYTLAIDDYFPTLQAIDSTIPDMLIFNRKGECVSYKNGGTCTAPGFSFLEQLSDTAVYTLIESINFDSIALSLRDFQGQEVTLTKQEKTDFYVFIYWVKWMGKLNTTSLRAWEQQIQSNQQTDIEVFKVNMDQQAHWNLDKWKVGKASMNK